MATHKRSAEKIESRHGAMQGITNLFSNSEGLMQNSKADNVISASVSQRNSQLYKGGWIYPISQDERIVKFVHYKDENCNWQKRKIYIKSAIAYTERDFKTDITLGAKYKNGKYLSRSDLKKEDLSFSGILQKAKAMVK